MAVYEYPPMPLDAHVWYESGEPPPGRPPDATVKVSLSPLRPEDWFATPDGTVAFHNYFPTHIIRSARNDAFGESFIPGKQTPAYPCTVFEVPPESGHFYVALWCHVVGAGFPNEHARVYVTRYGYSATYEDPLFKGYI